MKYESNFDFVDTHTMEQMSEEVYRDYIGSLIVADGPNVIRLNFEVPLATTRNQLTELIALLKSMLNGV